MSANLTWTIVKEVAVCVLPALKVVAGEAVNAFRMCSWGVAMNCHGKTGERFDLEVASLEGFGTVGLYDPEQEIEVDFEIPRVGEWIKVLNARVSDQADEYGKRKIRVASAWQLRRVSKQSARVASSDVPKTSRRRRSV